MGFWSIFRKKGTAPEETAPAEERPPEPEARRAPQKREEMAAAGPERDIAKICRVAEPGGPTPEEAVQLFSLLRGTPDEARAVEELVRTSQSRTLPEEILLSLGAALVDRGEPDVAAKVLAGASSSPALLMLGDLAERRGDLPTALSHVERVLLRDLDHPGARERHKRWRTQLGFDVEHKPAQPGATVVAREPDAPFDLLREVGRGGAGAVYEAIDRELGRHVALKVYHQPERDRAQLAHEAKVAARLEGPGIVRVFDIDPEHGWVALEWAQNGTLREQIRARAADRLLPIERWALSLAAGLARVHAAGWVHHDVKPANVLIARSGTAILTDFGIARRTGEASPAGSLGYVSPERMAGRASDPRDDVYGFGRVLEDVLDVVKDEAAAQRFRALATACTGPDAQRPADARALVTRLRVEILGA
jgi:tRNA A-37 threonylcarbamoyl transferase component Bud32